ncbi:uncharacterized protein LOC110036235 [Phalaenopsis equestris]|uniref:uncharacterized protein LOC110036235 n=1 Tax=Phalaenopsis equestris TaxID=78828 RepID=UPI0009E2E01C|nr:uncharacterized protein LOC110036235 [Phalaenopsis equestris]
MVLRCWIPAMDSLLLNPTSNGCHGSERRSVVGSGVERLGYGSEWRSPVGSGVEGLGDGSERRSSAGSGFERRSREREAKRGVERLWSRELEAKEKEARSREQSITGAKYHGIEG